MVVQLYQEHSLFRSTYNRRTDRSPTNSLGSYQNRAWKELTILRRNGRIPTVMFKVGLYRECSPQEINMYRGRIFKYLRKHGFEGVASIELTRGADGLPNNCVHFHVLSDDTRSEKELRALFNMACIGAGLCEGDFGVKVYGLSDGFGYFDYFTKCGKRYIKKIILFRNEKELGARIQKFYVLGGWFKKSGGKGRIWKAYIREWYGK